MHSNSRNLIWFGPRYSDIQYIEDEFKGAVTILGKQTSTPDFTCHSYESKINKRVNHNDDRHYSDINFFYKSEAEKFIKKNENLRFLFYGSIPSTFDRNLKDYCVGYNDSLVVSLLSDKMRMRTLLNHHLPVLNFTTRFFHECSYNKLEEIFPKSKSFVLQEPVGASGGFSTHIIHSEEDKILVKTRNLDLMVSPFYENVTSVNHNIIVYDSQVLSLPYSMQIIEEVNNKLLYVGGDYISAQYLDRKVKERLHKYSDQVGQILRNLDYRGVAGIDYLVKPNGEVLFIEINPRFQASTFLLNKSLIESGLPSVAQLHLMAFKHERCPVNLDLEKVDYSFLNSIKNSDYATIKEDGVHTLVNVQANKTDLNSEPVALSYEIINSPVTTDIESGAQLFTTIFKHPILTRNFNNAFKLHSSLAHYAGIGNKNAKIEINDIKESARLKFELLSLGAQISNSAKKKMEDSQTSLRYAIGYAMDIVIENDIFVNVPIRTKYAGFSPYSIDWNADKGFGIVFNNTWICNVDISLVHPLSSRTTQNGTFFNLIAQMINDRLRISPFPVCRYNEKNGLACKFCDIGYANNSFKYSFEDICEVVDTYLKEDKNLRHFLIGGGTAGENGWKLINNLTKFIRQQTDLGIYLMVAPPDNLSVLDDLYQNGITEVGFNIESYNRSIARRLMPGKAKMSLEEYFRSFRYATKLWGKDGNVRSILIVGIESMEDTLKGVEELCKLGVMPILSAFRPIPKTEMENYPQPSPDYIFTVWEKAQEICNKYEMTLGPKCIPCQNNTITFPVNDQYNYY